MHFRWMRWKHFELTSWKKVSYMTQRFANGNTHCDWLCPCACMYVCVCMRRRRMCVGMRCLCGCGNQALWCRVFHGMDSLPAGAWAEDDGALLGLTRSPPENQKMHKQPHTYTAHMRTSRPRQQTQTPSHSSMQIQPFMHIRSQSIIVHHTWGHTVSNIDDWTVERESETESEREGGRIRQLKCFSL